MLSKHNVVHGRLTGRINLDPDPINPRTDKYASNDTIMICWHHTRKLGDPHNYPTPDAFFREVVEEAGISTENSSPEEAAALFYQLHPTAQPLYLYDHSGLTISTAPFNDRWDSMRLGVIYIPTENLKRISNPEETIKAEVELYDLYLRGETYMVVVDGPDGDELDSCTGYYGLQHARQSLLQDILPPLAEADAKAEAAEQQALHERMTRNLTLNNFITTNTNTPNPDTHPIIKHYHNQEYSQIGEERLLELEQELLTALARILPS